MDIIIQNLKKNFGEKVAVNIDSFRIRGGEILGLVGNNGAGKSTLFRLILDLIKADEGTVRMFDASIDINVAETEEWKDWTGAFVDDSFLIDYLTPDEYFQFIARISGKNPEELQQFLDKFQHFMADEILGQKKFIRNLSAGNKQKVGIISTMLSRPDLIILDEPFNFLDPSSQIIIKRLLKEYHDTTGATILISSHNLQHTIDISTRIALLEKGHIVKDLQNEAGSAEAELEQYFSVE